MISETVVVVITSMMAIMSYVIDYAGNSADVATITATWADNYKRSK